VVTTACTGALSLSGAAFLPHGRIGRNRPQQGFTLVELMIGVVLVAVLLGIGMPLFSDFVLNQRLRATSSDLRIALTLGRSEAIKRNTVVELLPDAGGWGAGWTIPSPTVGEPDILNHVQSGDVAITTTPANATPEFSPAGRAAAAIKFEIDIEPDTGGTLGCLQLALDGKLTSTKGACL
jgi:type IV fimbrial biogenesis protein FimT